MWKHLKRLSFSIFALLLRGMVVSTSNYARVSSKLLTPSLSRKLTKRPYSSFETMSVLVVEEGLGVGRVGLSLVLTLDYM